MKKHGEILKYKSYLKGVKGFSASTIESYTYELIYYFKWRQKAKINSIVKYIDIVDYIEYQKKRNYSYQTINGRLTAIKHYYNFKKQKVNPVQNIRLKGREKKILTGLLSDEFITEIYQTYKEIVEIENTPILRRNLILLGLFCYQGIKTNEITKITMNHISLKDLTIVIPNGKRTNGRTMEIKSNQLIDLFQYITESREELLERIKKPTSENLIIGDQQEKDLRGVNNKIQQQLRERLSYFQSFSQIRNSKIVNWLKSNNLRKVQYMAGHKYVSSTEHFKTHDLSKLKERVLKNHPLG